VVHLVRRANGREPFDAFMASYAQHDAGAEHDLVLLFKGFDDAAQTRPYVERAEAHCARVRTLSVPDTGLDLTAYAAAAGRLVSHRLLFLNSFSEVAASGWLAKLVAASNQAGVGLVGASGSWESTSSLAARQAGLRNGYSEAFPDRRELMRSLAALSGSHLHSALRDWLFAAKMSVLHARQSPRFPNAHVRTNAFLVERELFASLAMGDLANKLGAYRFEGGHRSMTEQIRARGLDAIVVDRHGIARTPASWHDGEVFRQGLQRDLLITDNQTRAYAVASAEQRLLLSKLAWGSAARAG
jgi:hypothetical protein